MKRQAISLRSLQGVSLISALIAVIGGGTFVLNGTDGLAIVVGFDLSIWGLWQLASLAC